MNISQIEHLFCPSLYLDGLSGFLLALYLVHIPLQLMPIRTGRLDLRGK
jgi:hypothetical protein